MLNPQRINQGRSRMGAIFGQRLRTFREAKGISGKRLAELSAIGQGNLFGLEAGKRPPSDANLEALAGVTDLGISLEQLQAWRDLDRIGLEGVERLRKWEPEVLKGAIASEPPRPVRKETSDAIAQVVAQLPKDMRHPPTEKELKLIEKIGGFDGSELDPRSGSWLWTQPPEKRKPDLKQALKDWKELNDEEGAQPNGA